ncbi:hydroxyacid dehydrogenase [Brevundimonas sp. GW460-12-10-14-LB2]|jgi:lactate dehydrogenase-like 2-hydroxyacid dehydrogenase|uniref:2-hydroxyacid dehydrogenase n=1 Tax=Brevundimonas sp. GW460-12-10-14-LB2 TaxID=1827469 RepID=UPI0007BCABC6|nr:2-hydroxyacid dehydrogenase [Brevundimonas sp. GW460-12-10-14-LB2]ANC53590.1 hydroxyacid dehydrogenase [Brevundimonas sp. GW460-12-10-14-LB2]MEA3474691.1 2-hydroxyacid dehydrogenase [Pseudomonadota bacterium]
MTQRPAVLIMQRHLAPLSGFLESAYDVYRFWEGPPIEAAHEIRVMVVAGEAALDKALIERLPNLDLIACFTSGYDGIDIDWCRQRGLPVTHAPGVNHEDVADHALGLILAARRQIASGDRQVREGGWTFETRTITTSLAGQKLGIVGLGHIGKAVADRAEAFRMAVSWWGPRPHDAEWPRADSLLALAKASDILVVACKADETNRGLISPDIIEALGPDGLLVNVSRGQVVDEDALIAALKSGTLGQAALDVFIEEPTDPARWADVPNVILTPHTAGATTAGVQGMLMLLIENLQAHFAGEPLKTPVV